MRTFAIFALLFVGACSSPPTPPPTTPPTASSGGVPAASSAAPTAPATAKPAADHLEVPIRRESRAGDVQSTHLRRVETLGQEITVD